MAGGGYMGSIIIALPRKDTAGKIKEILLHHGFRDVVVPTAAAALQETGTFIPRNYHQWNKAF